MAQTQQLTHLAAKGAKPGEKPYKLAAGRGLFLLVHPNGSKYWRLKYRIAGKEKLVSLGVFPEITLTAAKAKRDELRLKLRDGIDPAAERAERKRQAKLAAEANFKTVAAAWLDKRKNEISPGTLRRDKRRLEAFLFPWLGHRPVSEITAPELLAVLRRIEARGHYDTAWRCKRLAGMVQGFAVLSGLAERNPANDITKDALTTPKTKHRAAILDPEKIGPLLNAIDQYDGHFVTRCALQLIALTFVRPGELRLARWGEFDREKRVWEIPAERMKMGKPHIVPLSDQALEILDELAPLTERGPDSLVFHSVRSAKRPLSDNTLGVALLRLGYARSEVTPHGFRAMARTLLDEELGFPFDVVEHQLAHQVRDATGRAYNRTEKLNDRAVMMQAYADYLDRLKIGQPDNVVSIKAAAGE